MVESCLLGVRYPDRIGLVTCMGADLGLSAGGAQGTLRGCSNEARCRVQGRELSLVGWMRSRGGEGLAGGGKWAFYWEGLGGAEGGTGVAWAGGGAEKGREPGREGAGVRAGGVRLAGLTSGASRSEFALYHSWQVSAERSEKVSVLGEAAPSAPAATSRPAPGATRLLHPAHLRGMARVRKGSRGHKSRL